MKFTKTTEYAFRILSFMAMDESKLYSANELFDNLQIPFRYMRKQLTLLSKSGLLISEQGKNGGYRIAKNPKDISLIDIVQASGENIIENVCFFGFQECAMLEKCAMHDKWIVINEDIIHVLTSTKLAEFKSKGPKVLKLNNNFINFKND